MTAKYYYTFDIYRDMPPRRLQLVSLIKLKFDKEAIVKSVYLDVYFGKRAKSLQEDSECLVYRFV